MTTFEQELVRAIEHGCPKCGWQDLELICTEARYYSLDLFDNGEIDYGSSEPLDSHNDYVQCGNSFCGILLWAEKETAGSCSGWIPELRDVVKGKSQ